MILRPAASAAAPPCEEYATSQHAGRSAAIPNGARALGSSAGAAATAVPSQLEKKAPGTARAKLAQVHVHRDTQVAAMVASATAVAATLQVAQRHLALSHSLRAAFDSVLLPPSTEVLATREMEMEAPGVTIGYVDSGPGSAAPDARITVVLCHDCDSGAAEHSPARARDVASVLAENLAAFLAKETVAWRIDVATGPNAYSYVCVAVSGARQAERRRSMGLEEALQAYGAELAERLAPARTSGGRMPILVFLMVGVGVGGYLAAILTEHLRARSVEVGALSVLFPSYIGLDIFSSGHEALVSLSRSCCFSPCLLGYSYPGLATLDALKRCMADLPPCRRVKPDTKLLRVHAVCSADTPLRKPHVVLPCAASLSLQNWIRSTRGLGSVRLVSVPLLDHSASRADYLARMCSDPWLSKTMLDDLAWERAPS